MLISTKEQFTARQGRFNLAERIANKLPAPKGLDKTHLYARQHLAAKSLLSRGKVVMACVIEASPEILSEGQDICEVSVAYSLDEFFDDMPFLMAEVAVTAADFRVIPNPTQEQRAVIHALSQQLLNFPLPKSITYDKDCQLTTVFIYRPHLPRPYLYRGFFPMLVLPEETDCAMVLPAHYWSNQMLSAWLEEYKA